MLGRTHAVAGLAAGLAFAGATHALTETPLAAYGLAAFAALLPDLDQHRSTASRYKINAPAHFVLRRFTHRRFTHSFVGVGVFAAVMTLLWAGANALGIGVSALFVTTAIAGYSSHIIADMFNKQGVQLFYPASPLGMTWWSVPLPRALRISTIYDPKGPPITLGRIQARIPTELLFRYAVYALVIVLAYNSRVGLLFATETTVHESVSSAPGPIADILSAILH
jgi:membrane-bound metal-dependent hydrolase YbcI (DUF457 family)